MENFLYFTMGLVLTAGAVLLAAIAFEIIRENWWY